MSLGSHTFGFDGDGAHLQGVSVNVDDLQSGLDSIIAYAKSKSGFCFFTLNLDHIVKLTTDARFQRAYRDAQMISADGWPVVWLLRRQGRHVQRTTGADIVEPVCARAAQEGLPIYFIGPSLASQTAGIEILRQRHPSLTVAGTEAPMLSDATDSQIVAPIAARLQKSRARLCIVSLGAPKQEILASELRRLCPEVGFLCVGAALDFISGHHVRAPHALQTIKLEWLWRMSRDPRRLGPRYLQCLLWFAAVAWRSHFKT